MTQTVTDQLLFSLFDSLTVTVHVSSSTGPLLAMARFVVAPATEAPPPSSFLPAEQSFVMVFGPVLVLALVALSRSQPLTPGDP